MIRIIIADDHTLLAESLQLILQQDNCLKVVGIASNGKEAVQLCRQLEPQVVLMDIKMQEYNGLKAAGIIKESLPHIKIIILTTFEDRDKILEAFYGGADGYLLKDVKPRELARAIKNVNSGFCVLSGAVKNILQEELSWLIENNKNPKTEFLKPGDLKIIKLISNGKSNREIAEMMNYAEGTIKNKISRMLDAIGAKDRTQIVLFALKNDLL